MNRLVLSLFIDCKTTNKKTAILTDFEFFLLLSQFIGIKPITNYQK